MAEIELNYINNDVAMLKSHNALAMTTTIMGQPNVCKSVSNSFVSPDDAFQLRRYRKKNPEEKHNRS